MADIVLIVGEYHPYFSAVGVCGRNIADAFQEAGHQVTVICMKARVMEAAEEDYHGQRIVRVSTRWWDARLRLLDRMGSARGLRSSALRVALGAWLQLMLVGLRAAGAVRSILSTTSIDHSKVQAFVGALRMSGPIDLLIPLRFPMEAVVAAMQFSGEHPRTRLVPYLFDPFVDSRTMHRTAWNMRLKRKRHEAIERHMMSSSSEVFCANQLVSQLSQYSEYSYKLVPTEHPLLRKGAATSVSRGKTDGRLTLAYAGLFDRRVRRPEQFLSLMLEVLPELDGHLDLYVGGDCGPVISSYCARSDDRIVDHGYAPKSDVDLVLAQSDVLVSVGNRDISQYPSKVIEYVALGKPIIHLFSDDRDQVREFLERYPLSLSLRQKDAWLAEDVRAVVEFCARTAGMGLDYEVVAKLFPEAQPDTIAARILAGPDAGTGPTVG